LGQAWASSISKTSSKDDHSHIGEEDKKVGAPSQMAIFNYGN